ICFSIGRFWWMHVAIGTLLACLAWTWIWWATGRVMAASSLLFVLGNFVALGLLVAATRERVRKMFLDLRRRDNLTRFLPPQVAERVMQLGDTSLQPTQRDVTVM